MTRKLNHQKMMKLEHFMKFSHETCVIEYLQSVLQKNGLEMVTKFVSLPLPRPLLPGLLLPPRQDSGGLSKGVSSCAYFAVFTVFTASCLSHVPSSENQNKEKRNAFEILQKGEWNPQSWLQV